VEGCPVQDTCLYYAPRIYIDIVPILQIAAKSENAAYRLAARIRRRRPAVLAFLGRFIPVARDFRYWREWPVTYLYRGQQADYAQDYSDRAKMDILRTSPYGVVTRDRRKLPAYAKVGELFRARQGKPGPGP
jgi:hypothetical protein